MNTSRPPLRRILIVDSQPLIKRGLTTLIDTTPDLVVCATAATYHEGFDYIAVCSPDLLITELSDDSADGFDLMQNIRSNYPDLPVLVFSTHNSPQYVRAILRGGANAYVSKQETGEALLFALRRVLDGKTYVSPVSGSGPPPVQ